MTTTPHPPSATTKAEAITEVKEIANAFRCCKECGAKQISKAEAAVQRLPAYGPRVATSIELIAVERRRQINVEGWTADHDDEHDGGELAIAAARYALENADIHLARRTPAWPWDPTWWKPSSDPIRNLVKAGALIAAEIDRHLRRLARDTGAYEPSSQALRDDPYGVLFPPAVGPRELEMERAKYIDLMALKDQADAQLEQARMALEILVAQEVISASRARELHGMSTGQQRALWRSIVDGPREATEAMMTAGAYALAMSGGDERSRAYGIYDAMERARCESASDAGAVVHYGSGGHAECGDSTQSLTLERDGVTCPTCRGYLPIIAAPPPAESPSAEDTSEAIKAMRGWSKETDDFIAFLCACGGFETIQIAHAAWRRARGK